MTADRKDAEAVRLTRCEKDAVRWLAEKHEKFPANDFGFNPFYAAKHAATCRRSLEHLGYVEIRRLSERHFRYLLTDLGKTLAASLKDQPQ